MVDEQPREILAIQLGEPVQVQTGILYRLQVEAGAHRLAVQLFDWEGEQILSSATVEVLLPGGEKQTLTSDGEGRLETQAPPGTAELHVAGAPWPTSVPTISDAELFIAVRIPPA